MKRIVQNKKAFFDYEILDRFEAGIVLSGDEVKSIRLGGVSLNGAFASIKQNELYLNNCHITHYERAYLKPTDEPTKARKLLVHRRELNRLIGDISQKGVTIVPLSVYFNKKNMIKVELGIAKHRKAVGKKQLLKERDIKRETEKETRGRW